MLAGLLVLLRTPAAHPQTVSINCQQALERVRSNPGSCPQVAQRIRDHQQWLRDTRQQRATAERELGPCNPAPCSQTRRIDESIAIVEADLRCEERIQREVCQSPTASRSPTADAGTSAPMQQLQSSLRSAAEQARQDAQRRLDDARSSADRARETLASLPESSGEPSAAADNLRRASAIPQGTTARRQALADAERELGEPDVERPAAPPFEPATPTGEFEVATRGAPVAWYADLRVAENAAWERAALDAANVCRERHASFAGLQREACYVGCSRRPRTEPPVPNGPSEYRCSVEACPARCRPLSGPPPGRQPGDIQVGVGNLPPQYSEDPAVAERTMWLALENDARRECQSRRASFVRVEREACLFSCTRRETGPDLSGHRHSEHRCAVSHLCSALCRPSPR